MTIWFTADPHIGHMAIISHSNRPFKNVDQMDDVLLGFWKNLLSSGDRLYIVGDIAMNRRGVLKAFDSLPSGVQVYVIFGNHDHDHRNAIDTNRSVVWSGSLKEAKIEGQDITMSHYAGRVWNRCHYGSWQLFGHSHGKLHPWERQLDVGVDSAAELLGEYRPFSFEEVHKFIKHGENPRCLAEQFGKAPSWMGGNHLPARTLKG